MTSSQQGQSDESDRIGDDGPECDLCGKTSCPDADLPEFSEPRNCALTPVYNALRYDRCDYGCGRGITTATVRRAARLLADIDQSTRPGMERPGQAGERP